MPKAIVAVLGAAAGVAGVLLARGRRTAAGNTALWEQAVGAMGAGTGRTGSAASAGEGPTDLIPPDTVRVDTRRPS